LGRRSGIVLVGEMGSVVVVGVDEGLKEFRRDGREAEGKMLGRREGRLEKFLGRMLVLCWRKGWELERGVKEVGNQRGHCIYSPRRGTQSLC
jgi:hypothetical protein